MGQRLAMDITSGRALSEPWRLILFSILSYADLKKYRFHYWASYPTPFNLPDLCHETKSKFAAQEFSVEQLSVIKTRFELTNVRMKCFFAILGDKDGYKVVSLARGVDIAKALEGVSFAIFEMNSIAFTKKEE